MAADSAADCSQADTSTPWVSLLSDYGVDDVFVGVCKGVLAKIAPRVRILDICHLIAPQDVVHGATALASAVPYLPVGVHVGLVDPLRADPVRGIAVKTTDGSVLVGPDNGLLSRAWAALGGAEAAYELTNDDWWLTARSGSFRGRDVFAPVAGHLSNGVPLEEMGPTVAVSSLARIDTRAPQVDDDHVHAEVVNVDHFGNLSLNCVRADLEAAGISAGDTVEVRCSGRSITVPFTEGVGQGSAGRLVLCEDSFRQVMLAVNLGHAAQTLRTQRGDPVVVSRVSGRPAAGDSSSHPVAARPATA